MTNEFDNEQEERSQLDAVDELDIAQLRKYAKLMRIPARKDWSKEDFVAAIKQKQAASTTTMFVFDSSQAPKPGYARVIVHRDPSPGHKNSPIHAGINGNLFSIPRGVEVDIPIPLVEVLANAKTIDTTEQASPSNHNPGGVYQDRERPSYPFQVLSVTPGEYVNKTDTRAQAYKLRKEFHEIHGTWPTDGELRDFKKTRMNKMYNP